MDGLALAVQEILGLDPFSGAAFVFRSKRSDRVKVLVWDRTGLVLVHKRLEGAKFVWPQIQDGVMTLSPAQFSALFEDEEDQKTVRWTVFPTHGLAVGPT